ncbi:TetR/AcrR family transcriptional regulator [Kitasatospora sp. NPDC094011]|uniref:TetR/AcrR family transcriptional regulator n=1 Tax=Kitasatospora sp. NPDC094011 TaxID=3364090 RepID=UPI00381AE607
MTARNTTAPRRQPLGRERIIDETWALAADRGLAAVTMRAVADRLGVTPMALYRHVGDKQGLLDGLVERLLGEIRLPDPDLPWPDRLAQLAQGIRAVARAHPDLFPLLFARSAITEPARRPREAAYSALREAGLDQTHVERAERMLSTFVLGFASSEAAGRFEHIDADAEFAYATDALRKVLVP